MVSINTTPSSSPKQIPQIVVVEGIRRGQGAYSTRCEGQKVKHGKLECRGREREDVAAGMKTSVSCRLQTSSLAPHH
ncbi:hypothetical protein SUGI_0173250 [Cryptomeria japonica]|nr:hypothetical protein SUGI_0173250 [Cryptomeria japonica]